MENLPDAPDAPPFPCLYGNNCISKSFAITPQVPSSLEHALKKEEKEALQAELVPQTLIDFPDYQKRVASMIADEVEALGRIMGNEHLGFLTLTFADHVVDRDEASDRYRSLRANVLSDRYQCGICKCERQRSGRLHYHLIIAHPEDLKTGVDFAAFQRGDYRTAPPPLLDEWAHWRSVSKAYGFGRVELLPIKSNAQATGRYVGGYIKKDWLCRLPEDVRRRLIGFFGYGRTKSLHRRSSLDFAWNSTGARAYRLDLAVFAAVFGLAGYEEFQSIFGPKWAYHLREWISRKEYMEADPFACAQIEAARIAGQKTTPCLAVPQSRENFRLRLKRLAEGLPAYQERLQWYEMLDEREKEQALRQIQNRWAHLTAEDIRESIEDYERKATWKV